MVMRLRHGVVHLAALLIALFAITLGALILGAVIVHALGDTTTWQVWLRRHAWWLALWRLALYGLIVRGWWWMRRRVREREASPDAQRRLLRAEIAAVLAVVLTELIALRGPV